MQTQATAAQPSGIVLRSIRPGAPLKNRYHHKERCDTVITRNQWQCRSVAKVCMHGLLGEERQLCRLHASKLLEVMQCSN